MRSIITLLTDFGVSSPYVAQMKGAMLCLDREALIVDVTHAIGPQNIVEAAVVLADVTHRFPAGTIHLAVVDPGVGTPRRLVYAECGSQRYLAPDNGLLTLVIRRSPLIKLIELQARRYWSEPLSSTFHGRDILAPVAAHLSLGLAADKLGPLVENFVTLNIPRPQIAADHILGHILLVDSFGNLITNIEQNRIEQIGGPQALTVTCKQQTVFGISRTYRDGRPGEMLALVDSQGRLEISVTQGSAALLLGADMGTSVVVRRQ